MLLLAFLMWSNARGAEAPNAVITTDFTLDGDYVIQEAGDGLVVGANDITIDGNGFALISTAPMGVEEASTGSFTVAGIRVDGRSRVTIKNFSEIRGFYTGVSLSGGGNNVVESCTFDGTGRGVQIDGGTHTVRNCTVRHAFTGVRVALGTGSSTLLEDNLFEECVRSMAFMTSVQCRNNVVRRCCDRDNVLAAGAPIRAGMILPQVLPTQCGVGETNVIKLQLRTPTGAASDDAVVDVRVIPESSVLTERNGNQLNLTWTPGIPGLHRLRITATDAEGNMTVRGYPLQVGDGAEHDVVYTLRHDGPHFGQTPERWDTGSLGFKPTPGDPDVVRCGGWVQFSPNQIPNLPAAVVEGARIQGFLGFKPAMQGIDPNNTLCLQRLASFDGATDFCVPIPDEFPKLGYGRYTWGEFEIGPVDWSIDEYVDWHGFTFKMIGRYPQIWCGEPDSLSQLTIHCRIPATPEVTFIENKELKMLSATQNSDSLTTLVFDGPAEATRVGIANWNQAFLGIRATVAADTACLHIPSIDKETVVLSVPMWVSSPHTVDFTATSPDSTVEQAWEIRGEGSAVLRFGGLGADVVYDIISGNKKGE